MSSAGGTKARILEARGLRKGYLSGSTYLPVIQELDLTVEEGEMVAIVGASGVGKSTLLHVLGTLDVPENGTVRIAGEDAFALDERARTALRNRTIGFIFQFHHLLPEFSALENVMMPLRIARQPPADASRRAEDLLRRIGLAERVHHRPAELSGGEQQRVAVARALAASPRLVLADEPTGNLDPHTSQELIGIFRELHSATGLTSVLVTHSEKLAAASDRVLQMEEGKLREG
jgi:lipoprotein-releasing system ATP-binding protein